MKEAAYTRALMRYYACSTNTHTYRHSHELDGFPGSRPLLQFCIASSHSPATTYSDANEKSGGRPLIAFLHHLNVYRNSGRKVDVGECLNDLRVGIDDVYHALVNAHLELLARVFVDECGAVDRVFLDVDGERYGADDRGVVAGGGIDDLLHRFIENAVLVGANLDAEAVYGFRFLGACDRCSGSVGRLYGFFRAWSAFLGGRFCCHRARLRPLARRRTRRVCTTREKNANPPP